MARSGLRGSGGGGGELAGSRLQVSRSALLEFPPTHPRVVDRRRRGRQADSDLSPRRPRPFGLLFSASLLQPSSPDTLVLLSLISGEGDLAVAECAASPPTGGPTRSSSENSHLPILMSLSGCIVYKYMFFCLPRTAACFSSILKSGLNYLVNLTSCSFSHSFSAFCMCIIALHHLIFPSANFFFLAVNYEKVCWLVHS